MRNSLQNPATRERLIGRLDLLRPDSGRKWGRMTAPQMLAHLTDWFAMARGDLVIRPRRHIASRTPVKQFLIYVFPIPRGVIPTATELISRPAAEWDIEKAELSRRIRSFDERALYPTHPLFGAMTPGDWGVLGYRHTDHHLRQFGV